MIETLCTGSTPGRAIATSACPISWCATISRSRGLSTRFFFSNPAMMRSTALLKSSIVTASALRRVASNAASLTRLARIGAREAGRERCDLLGIDVRGELHLFHVNAKNLHTSLLIRPIHQHLPVKASGPQQRRIENLRAIRGRKQHDADRWVEAVELGQKLVQRLLTLIMATGDLARGARPPKSVEFVDEDDRRGGFPGLLEQVAHPCGTDAHEHLDKL